MRLICRSVTVAATIVFTLPAFVETARAWGSSGHSAVAEVAERGLSDQARIELAELIGHRSLASLASWSDTFAKTNRAARAEHFVNIPFDAEGYRPPRDCKSIFGPTCVVQALGLAIARLGDRTAAKTKRIRALKQLAHLIADIHQPLHCVNRGDAGGTQFAVTFFGQKTNLHLLWDFVMLDRASFDWGEHVAKIELEIVAEGLSLIDMGTPVTWAKECHRLGRLVYPAESERDLGRAYQQKYLPVVYRQLAIASVRLRKSLEKALIKPGTVHD